MADALDAAAQAGSVVPSTIATLNSELAAAKDKWSGLGATLTGLLPFGDSSSQDAVQKNLSMYQNEIAQLQTRGQLLMQGTPQTMDDGQSDDLTKWTSFAKLVLDDIKSDAQLEDESDVATVVGGTIKATASDVKHDVESGLNFWAKYGKPISIGIGVLAVLLIAWPVVLFAIPRRRA